MKEIMKYFMILMLAACAISCSPTQIKMLAPNHVGIAHSCEWEVQKNQNVKHKPKVQICMDWNI